MRRAAVERRHTLTVWRRHLRMHRGTPLCVCEFQVGRFRKGQRIGGCGRPGCWLCHWDKLAGEPKVPERRCAVRYAEELVEVALPSNNRWRGP